MEVWNQFLESKRKNKKKITVFKRDTYPRNPFLISVLAYMGKDYAHVSSFNRNEVWIIQCFMQ